MSTTTKIDPGYGYRLLKDGESIKDTDDYSMDGKSWYRRDGGGSYTQMPYFYPTRRKIEPPPGYEIVPENEEPNCPQLMCFRTAESRWDRFSFTDLGRSAGSALGDYRAFARKIKEQPKVEPGYGYRLLGDDERFQDGDEVYDGDLEQWTESFWHNPARRLYLDVRNTPAEVRKDAYAKAFAFRRRIDVGEVEPATKPENLGAFPAPEPPAHYIVVSKPSPGYYRPASNPYIHVSAESAEKEAQRLANEHAGKFVVFKATKAFERGEVKEVAVA